MVRKYRVVFEYKLFFVVLERIYFTKKVLTRSPNIWGGLQDKHSGVSRGEGITWLLASEKKILEKERRQSGGKWGWGDPNGACAGRPDPCRTGWPLGRPEKREMATGARDNCRACHATTIKHLTNLNIT